MRLRVRGRWRSVLGNMCHLCKHWTETTPHLRYGECAAKGILTEWCAGIAITPKRVTRCRLFSAKGVVEKIRSSFS